MTLPGTISNDTTLKQYDHNHSDGAVTSMSRQDHCCTLHGSTTHTTPTVSDFGETG